MTADPQQKIKFEQRAVIGLAGVFVLTLLLGPLKRFGPFRAKPLRSAPTPAFGTVDMSKPLPDTLKAYEQRVEQQLEVDGRSGAARSQPVAEPIYTAQALRDPLKSLLPTEPPKPNTPAGQAARPQAPAAPPKPPPPPPALTVEGVLWGGSTPRAIIEGQVYGVGDTVEGVKILEIDRRGVIIDHHGTLVVYPATAEMSPHGTAGLKSQRVQWR